MGEARPAFSWRRLQDATDRPGVLVVIAAAVYGAFLASLLVQYEFDVSRFIVLGERFTVEEELATGLYIYRDLPGDESWGYDGQFYYRLALDPLTTTRTEHGVTLDLPELRQQRIVYPLLSWALALGRPAYVPFSMVAVNFIALLLIAWCAGSLAQAAGRHAWWGSTIVFYPGLLLSLARNLTEVVAVCFLLAGILFHTRRQYPASGVSLALAALSRETALITAGAFALREAYQSARARRPVAWRPVLSAALPIVCFAAWHQYLGRVWDQTAAATDVRFSLTMLPFSGLAEQLANNPAPLYWMEVALILAVSGAALLSVKSSVTAPSVRLAWGLYCAIFIFFSATVWSEDWSFLRVTADFVALGVLIVFGRTGRTLLLSIWLFTMVLFGWLF
jgi:hypothetical protein